jgi:hypothetical protein
MSDGDPRDDASSAASPFPAAYGAVGGTAADPSTRAPGRRPLSERRPAEGGDRPSVAGRLTGALRKRQQDRLARVGTTAPSTTLSPTTPQPTTPQPTTPQPTTPQPTNPQTRAVPSPDDVAAAGPLLTAPARPGRRRVALDPAAGNGDRPSTAVTTTDGLPVGTVPAPSAPAPRMAPTSPRRGPVPPVVDPAVPETPSLDRRDRRTPDWMAQRVAESVVHDAPFEIGKERRWRRRKVTVMRTRVNRRMVRRIDTWTVFKVSFVFYLLMVIVVLVAGTVTWSVAQHLGFVGDIQKSVRSLADDKKFILHGSVAFRYSAAGGAVLGLIGTLLNTVAAMLYNLLSDVIGGIQVIVVTEPD